MAEFEGPPGQTGHFDILQATVSFQGSETCSRALRKTLGGPLFDPYCKELVLFLWGVIPVEACTYN